MSVLAPPGSRCFLSDRLTFQNHVRERFDSVSEANKRPCCFLTFLTLNDKILIRIFQLRAVLLGQQWMEFFFSFCSYNALYCLRV